MSNLVKSAKELGNEFLAKQKEYFEYFESKKTADGYRMTDEERETHVKHMEELADLQKAHENAIADEAMLKSVSEYAQSMNRVATPDVVAGSTITAEPVVKSLEQIIAESPAFKNGIAAGAHRSGVLRIDIPEYKTTMTTAAGFAPQTVRNGAVVPYAVYGPTIESLIPSYNTTDNAVKYMEETTHTNNNAPTAENAVLSESALAYTERTASIEDIGAFLPVTERQIEDVPAVASLIEDRLSFQNAVKRAYYLVNGNGSTPQIRGFLSATGLQTQAKGTDSAPDAIHKAITNVNVTGAANASAVVMNPTDWQNVRLLKTTDGVYIYGNPSESIEPRMWGLPVALENQLGAGTAVVGDFRMYAQIANRKGITVELGRSGDDFKYNRFTARVISRMGLVIYRGSAFCQVTGL